MVFDAPRAKGTFSTRIRVARDALRGCGWARVVTQVLCVGPKQVNSMLETVMQQGGEGLMLRHPIAEYKGSRSTNLLKVKQFFDKDAVVIGYTAGMGCNLGCVGTLVCVDGGKSPFNIGTGLSDEQRDAPPSVSSCITYRYQNIHASGVPRFLVFVRVRLEE